MIRNSFWELENIGRIQLSKSFYLRDFLHSEIAATYGLRNAPTDLDCAVENGRRLCATILEPLQETFGRIHIRSGYRSSELNQFGNERGLKCSRNSKTFADHIWDVPDAAGNHGASACVVVPWFANQGRPDDWPTLARWIAQHLDFHRLVFFAHQTSFNIGWRDNPAREIRSYRAPLGVLTRKALTERWGDHPDEAEGYPTFRGALTPLEDVPWTPGSHVQRVANRRDWRPRRAVETHTDERPHVTATLL